jgi:ABC-type antimicrobial peptide transport system permease subunit
MGVELWIFREIMQYCWETNYVIVATTRVASLYHLLHSFDRRMALTPILGRTVCEFGKYIEIV